MCWLLPPGETLTQRLAQPWLGSVLGPQHWVRTVFC